MGRTPPRALARAAHAPSLSPGEQRGVCTQGAAGCWLGTALLAARAGWSPGSSPSGRLGQLRSRRCRPHRAGPCGEKVSRRARRVRSHALPQLWSREGAAFCSATRPLRPHSHVQHSMPALPCVDAFPGLRPRVELPGEPRSLPQCEPLPPGWGAGGARRWPGQGARQPRAPSPRPPAPSPPLPLGAQNQSGDGSE